MATSVENGSAVTLRGTAGQVLGSGIWDRRDGRAAWRRFSWAEGVAFGADYIAGAIEEAVGRRAEESCRRLISSDADYLPGLTVEAYEDLIAVTIETAAVEAQRDLIVEVLQGLCAPREIVFLDHHTSRAAFGIQGPVRTQSGNNLKGSWVEVDGVAFRLDLMQPEKPRIALDQREQHSLVASLCEGRCVLDAFAGSGAFALHAMKAGAEHAVALDVSESHVKAIGAHAQRNGCFVEAIGGAALAFLNERTVGELDCIILDPPEYCGEALQALHALHASALRCLPSGGLLATYCRSETVTLDQFERMVSEAAGSVGREGRIFARTSQPFDFPTLLNFPESHHLKGLILQVE